MEDQSQLFLLWRTHAGIKRRERRDLENAQKYDFIKRG